MRSTTAAFILAAVPFVFADQVSLTSTKRGLCYVAGDNPSDDQFWDNSSSILNWYYNYQPSPTSGIDSRLEFVPMLWGAPANAQDTGFYTTVKGLIDGGMNINYVLGFNEPDGCSNGGSCVDAQTAADTWIREIEPLKELGVKLGAPAVTGSPGGFTWLENFYNACEGNCTTDFIPVHWYGNFEGMASHMGQVNGTYPNMTMWVTELGFPNQDLAATQEFFNQSISYMDRLDYVTHYSWFGAFRSSVSNVGPNNAFLTGKGKLTDIGANYIGQKETGNVPSSSDATYIARFAGWSVFVMAAVLWTA